MYRWSAAVTSTSQSSAMPNTPCGPSRGSPFRTRVDVVPADSLAVTRPLSVLLVAESVHAPDQRRPPKSRPCGPLKENVGTASSDDRLVEPIKQFFRVGISYRFVKRPPELAPARPVAVPPDWHRERGLDVEIRIGGGGFEACTFQQPRPGVTDVRRVT
jgi:hypothetical protein